MRIKLVAALCAGLTLSACAAPKGSFSLAPAVGQQSIVRDGVPALVSEKRHVAFLRPVASHQNSSGRPAFVVALYNRGRVPATLRTTEIAVAMVKPTRARLKVYSHEELVAEVEAQRNAKMALAVLGGVAGAMSASQAGYSTTTGSYGGSTRYGNGYGTNYGGTYVATTYNPAVAQAAADANAQRMGDSMASIQGQAQGRLDQLQSSVLKDHTLMPGEWHGGVIVFDPPQKTDTGVAEYAITVVLDGEQHTFTITQRGRAST